MTGQVGWALLACATVVAVFAPLALRSYSRGWPVLTAPVNATSRTGCSGPS